MSHRLYALGEWRGYRFIQVNHLIQVPQIGGIIKEKTINNATLYHNWPGLVQNLAQNVSYFHFGKKTYLKNYLEDYT